MTIVTNDRDDQADDVDAREGVTRLGGRASFLFALRRGCFAVVPKPLATAVAAIEGITDLEREVMTAQPEGLAVFCQRIADDVLSGRGFPPDFAEAAYEAQRAADRVNAQSIAVQAVRERLHETFPAVVTAALPDLLGGLRSSVKETMAELRKVDQTLGDLDLASATAVASASDEERSAFLRFNELHLVYMLARYAQRSALQASDSPVPGWNDMQPWLDWSQVFETGLHEVADPREYGSLTGSLGSASRFRGLAHRPDVWVPSVEELATAWKAFTAPRPQPATSTIESTGITA